MMLFRVIRHEILVLSRDRSLWAALVVLGVLTVYGVFNGLFWTGFQNDTLAAIAREDEEKIAQWRVRVAEAEQRDANSTRPVFRLDDPRSPSVAASKQAVRHAVLPPGPLAALAIGQSDLLPYYVQPTLENKHTFLDNSEIENPAHLLSGRCDLGFVLATLFPLVILALSYNLLSADREQGTLAQVLCEPVSLRLVATGKVLARGLVVAGLAIVLSTVAFLVGGGRFDDPDTLLRFGGYVVVVLAYGAFWLALAIAVNALGRSSSFNALALAGLWLAFALVIPSLIALAVSTAYPMPSRIQLELDKRAAANEAKARGSQLLKGFYEDHPELLPERSRTASQLDTFAVTAQAVREEEERIIAPLLEQFDRQLERQQRLVDWFRFLSPTVLADEAFQDLAGTGRHRHRAYFDQVAAFHERWREFFLPKIFKKEKLTTNDLDQVPTFEFVEESLTQVGGRVAVAVLGLLLPTLAVGAWGLARLRRYPITGSE